MSDMSETFEARIDDCDGTFTARRVESSLECDVCDPTQPQPEVVAVCEECLSAGGSVVVLDGEERLL